MIVKIDEINSDVLEFILKYFPNFKESSSPFNRMYIYTEEGIVKGFISFSVMYERAELDYIVVIPSLRGKGVSQMLFGQLLKDSFNCQSISLEVRSDNDRAIGFYLKNGFKKVATRKNYYKEVDAILMVREVR